MKKLLIALVLSLVVILGFFGSPVAAVAFTTMGSPAIDQGDLWTAGYTVVLLDNPATVAGVITTVNINGYSTLSNLSVASFYLVSASYLSTRASQSLGSLSGGAQSVSVSLEVAVGDMIGYYSTGYGVCRNTTGGSGAYYYNGNVIPCTNQNFGGVGARLTSLNGTGLAYYTYKTSGVTSATIGKVSGVLSKNIGKVIGK